MTSVSIQSCLYFIIIIKNVAGALSGIHKHCLLSSASCQWGHSVHWHISVWQPANLYCHYLVICSQNDLGISFIGISKSDRQGNRLWYTTEQCSYRQNDDKLPTNWISHLQLFPPPSNALCSLSNAKEITHKILHLICEIVKYCVFAEALIYPSDSRNTNADTRNRPTQPEILM